MRGMLVLVIFLGLMIVTCLGLFAYGMARTSGDIAENYVEKQIDSADEASETVSP